MRLIQGTEETFSGLVPTELRQHDPKRTRLEILPDGSRYFGFQSRFDFHISRDSKAIVGLSLDNEPQAAFKTYMLGHLLSHILLAFGIETIHAACLVVNGEAVAILGDSARGKSTLAAAFLREGDILLSDDFLVLQQRGGSYIAYPGFPRIKLYERVSKHLLPDDSQGTPMNQHHCPKFVYPLEDIVREPVPLRAFYALPNPKSVVSLQHVRIDALTQREAYLELTENSFNVRDKTPKRLTSQFEWATELVKRVPVKRLSYPRVLSVLPEVIAAVKEDLAAYDDESRKALPSILPTRTP
ncbi:MAG: hypothetical protein ABIP12_04150 [Terriglobales bacterium]